jgi:large subunit ribosomal protein L24
MPGLRIRKNDTVEVISGKDKGKRGRVIEVLPKVERVRVEGVNKIVERENPVHVSNVALIDPKSDKPTRIGMKTMPDGTRVRVSMRSGQQLDK